MAWKSPGNRMDVPSAYMWRKMCDIAFAPLWPGSDVAATLPGGPTPGSLYGSLK